MSLPVFSYFAIKERMFLRLDLKRGTINTNKCLGRKSMSKIIVNNTEIQVIMFEEEDYISLTDMVRNIENCVVLIEKWLI